MKKVLVVITTSFVSYGGLATVALNYYRNINRELIETDFASTNKIQGALEKELIENCICYIQLPPRKSLKKYVHELRRLAYNYDCVHIHGNSATTSLELFALNHVPKRIVHIHNTTCTHKIIHKIFLPYFRKHVTDGIACSVAAGNWIYGENNFTVLNNAIDICKYNYRLEDRIKIRNKLNIEGEIVIGNVGKLITQKNHAFALDVFSHFLKKEPTAKLVLVGGGELQKSLEAKAIALGIEKNVIFCGMVDNAQEYYSAFDCMLFPSLWEGLPLSLIEAQATGLGCVASDVITDEVNMGGVIRLGLNESVEKWVECLKKTISLNRQANLFEYRSNIERRGFDIKKNAAVLERLYLK